MFAPALLTRAGQELGVHETPGSASTARILQYRQWAGVTDKIEDGSRPWCADFVNAMLSQVHLRGSGSGMARSFSKWGRDCPVGTPGAVTVISSSRGPASGHVFIATGRMTATHIEGRGGNQSDAVTDDWWPRSRIVASRWPAELQPPIGRPTVLASKPAKGEARDA